MDLVEFLRARLDAVDAEAGCYAHCDGCEGDECDVVDARVLVLEDVAAKRRILGAWADPFGNWSADQADAARAMKERVLRLLALPYAGHPDYDPAWRL